MELTPRPTPTTTSPRRRRPWAYAVLALVLVAVGVVAYQGLTSASLYFYNADEAAEQRAELAGRRIRVQGVVQDDVQTRPSDTGITFTIAFNGVELPVEHQGDPPELFAPGEPVVLEGEFDGSLEAFMSDEIKVKHDEQYEAENQERLDDAEDGRTGDTSNP